MNKIFTPKHSALIIVVLFFVSIAVLFTPQINKSAVVISMIVSAALAALSYGMLARHIIYNWAGYNTSLKTVNIIIALCLLPMLLLMLFLPYAVSTIQC
ncbi:hypothetical protein LJ707_13090 [Mucilaginibacter sp. UR6-1]|uniref:hypothetical protein n=1 Tax=Mucilaginibacter sp. UR6-1 TaxID=1435643 RepID=UPI001E5F5B38|nr:hypothetical protein [Mucilaginibacter sp. UR6-1]MCC8409866.1 hypothetical protein [Mucilaginibacter sp. UR6-1]